MRLLAVLLLAACGSSSSSSPAPAADPLVERMRRCPLTVEGASAEVEDVAGGVAFTVRAEGDAVSEIRRRAVHVADLAAARAGGGAKAGGGQMRRCPIVTVDTRITVEDVDGGSRLVVAAVAPDGVSALREESRARLARLP